MTEKNFDVPPQTFRREDLENREQDILEYEGKVETPTQKDLLRKMQEDLDYMRSRKERGV